MKSGISLSARLLAVCQAVEELITSYTGRDDSFAERDASLSAQLTGLCDVGCDHAWVPISLLKRGVIKTAVGLDVHAGPLERARENMREYGILEQTLSLRLSNGLERLNKGEAQIVVMAGMGGLLMIDILERSDVRSLGVLALVFSPHTKQSELRKYLRTHGFLICAEKEVCDDGKFYPIISACVFPERDTLLEKNNGLGDNGFKKKLKADTAEKKEKKTETGTGSNVGLSNTIHESRDHILEDVIKETSCTQETAIALCDKFGPVLLSERDEVLHAYLIKREKTLRALIVQIEQAGHGSEEVIAALEDIHTVLTLWN